jgi:hypothetical protein
LLQVPFEDLRSKVGGKILGELLVVLPISFLERLRVAVAAKVSR